jgi:glutamyl-tRNA reductase
VRPLVIGANHRSSSLGLRDALFIDDRQQPDFLAALDLPDILALSTCDRVEIWALHDDPILAESRIVEALARHAGIQPDQLAPQLYVLTDRAALSHCFKVAASLDSQVIGEPNVLGQVKAAHRLSRAAGRSNAAFEDLLASSYTAAKRVRSETAVAERPVSIASAAVKVARDLHGDLAHTTALLIGTGDMGELVGEHLLAGGLGRLVVTSSKLRRAEALADLLKCHVAPIEQLADRLNDADIVISAVGARQTSLNAEHIAQTLRRRRRKPMFLIDMAMPGDIEPAVGRLDGAFLYDLADLERLAMEGLANREQAALRAFIIVDALVDEFLQSRVRRQAVPAIILLRQHFEKLRQQALSEAGGDADKATRLLVNRLLHEPSEMMKAIAGTDGQWPAAEELLKRIFRLEG